MANASACAERATSETLAGPDWAINIELCDIINLHPWQTKDALKVLKKRLRSRHASKQLLALFVLETLSKNCGDNIFQLIAERDILNEMVKIVKKKSDLNVREKVLCLIDTWQEVLGGRYPQYYRSFQELKTAGIEFPPRSGNVVSLFTPAQTQATVNPPVYENPANEASNLSTLTLSAKEIENAQGLADVLDDMLCALYSQNREGVNQEVIVDLVDQCHTYQNRVRILVNSTTDEGLLFQGLELNDKLHRVLLRHENMVKGKHMPTELVGIMSEASVVPVMNVNHEDEETDDEFAHLDHRSSRETFRASPFLPPHLSNYLSGVDYKSEYNQNPSAPPYTINSATSPIFTCPPVYDEPSPKSSQFPISLPPPPANYYQRQQFFEKQQHTVTGGPSHSRNSSGSASSYDSLMAQTRDLSLSSTPPNKEEKSEDALFKDLVDFAKSKSTTASKYNRSY